MNAHLASHHSRRLLLVVTLLAWLLPGLGTLPRLATAAETIPQPSLERLRKGLPIAAQRERVDLAMPVFSHPTRITNPLFPISQLHSTVLLGHIDRRTFRTETTLLPDTRTIEWMGRRIECQVSQYTAYLDGRIEEVALDFYAQADDGAVWYLGEDVYNYEDGVIADRAGTWIAGDDGPPAMIMPAQPRSGDVFRPENIPGVVFEEVRVLATSQGMDGPRGRVSGAITTQELGMDGGLSYKTFAPGYGEFSTGHDGELEALAVAVPTDARKGPMPAELEALALGAEQVFDAARSGDWPLATKAAQRMQQAWRSFRADAAPPPMLAAHMDRTLGALEGDALAPALSARHAGGAQRASLAASLAALDLQLLYRPPVQVDRDRLQVWARQLLFDTGIPDSGPVAGDVTTLEWIRDRIVRSLGAGDARAIDLQLKALRTAADAEDLEASRQLAPRLLHAIAGMQILSSQP